MNELILNNSVQRKNVFAFEKLMERGEKVELTVKHYFSDGLYARELFIPKGIILTGKIHKFEQLNIMSLGEMDILINAQIKRIKAPFTIVSPPGTKRLARAIEDTIWTTILRTDLNDPDKIESYFVTNSEEEYQEFLKANEQFKLPI